MTRPPAILRAAAGALPVLLVLAFAGSPSPAQEPKPTPAPAGGMEASLALAAKLFEMDTAAWAASDQAQPVLEKLGKKIKSIDDVDFGYVQWKDGALWHVLFFLGKKGDVPSPLVDVALPPPLTRRSRGTLTEYPDKGTPPLSGEALLLARATIVSRGHVEKALGIRSKPFFNQYVLRDSGGAFRAVFVPSDQENGQTRLGPDYDLILDAAGEKVVEERRYHKYTQLLKIGAAAGQATLSQPQVLCLSTPQPEIPDFLCLLLHPELSPISATALTGRYRMKSGEVPAFLPYWIQATPGASPPPDEDGPPPPASPPAKDAAASPPGSSPPGDSLPKPAPPDPSGAGK